MLLTITNEQKITVTLAPTTAAGNPATLDGIPQWTQTVGNSTLEVSEDGMSATLISGPDASNSQFTVTADADLGEGVVNLTDTIDLAVVLASASQLGLNVGTPELK